MPTNSDTWFLGGAPVSKGFMGETQVYPVDTDPGGGPGEGPKPNPWGCTGVVKEGAFWAYATPDRTYGKLYSGRLYSSPDGYVTPDAWSPLFTSSTTGTSSSLTFWDGAFCNEARLQGVKVQDVHKDYEQISGTDAVNTWVPHFEAEYSSGIPYLTYGDDSPRQEMLIVGDNGAGWASTTTRVWAPDLPSSPIPGYWVYWVSASSVGRSIHFIWRNHPSVPGDNPGTAFTYFSLIVGYISKEKLH